MRDSSSCHTSMRQTGNEASTRTRRRAPRRQPLRPRDALQFINPVIYSQIPSKSTAYSCRYISGRVATNDGPGKDPVSVACSMTGRRPRARTSTRPRRPGKPGGPSDRAHPDRRPAQPPASRRAGHRDRGTSSRRPRPPRRRRMNHGLVDGHRPARPQHRASQPAGTRIRRTIRDAGNKMPPMATGQD